MEKGRNIDMEDSLKLSKMRRNKVWRAMVSHACNPGTQKAETGGIEVQVYLQLCSKFEGWSGERKRRGGKERGREIKRCVLSR